MGLAFASARAIGQGFGLLRGCAGPFHAKDAKIFKSAALYNTITHAFAWMKLRSCAALLKIFASFA
jgi:hypothetical protein